MVRKHGKRVVSVRTGNDHLTINDRINLCLLKEKHPFIKQKDLVILFKQKYGLSISQPTVSYTLLKFDHYVNMASLPDRNLNASRECRVHYPLMEEAVMEWFRNYQEQANITGDLIKKKAIVYLDKLYPSHGKEDISNGWLEGFKHRHGISSHRRFGESGSVNMEMIANALPAIREKLGQFELKDIFNMDETGLFYRMEASCHCVVCGAGYMRVLATCACWLHARALLTLIFI